MNDNGTMKTHHALDVRKTERNAHVGIRQCVKDMVINSSLSQTLNTGDMHICNQIYSFVQRMRQWRCQAQKRKFPSNILGAKLALSLPFAIH